MASPDFPIQLPALGVLSELDDQERAELSTLGKAEICTNGDVLIKERDHQNRLYLLLDGRLRVERQTDGQTVTLGELRTGEFFGEMAVLDPGRASATVTCDGKAKLWSLTREDFLRFAGAHPAAGVKILLALGAFLTRRLRATSEKLPASLGNTMDGWW